MPGTVSPDAVTIRPEMVPPSTGAAVATEALPTASATLAITAATAPASPLLAIVSLRTCPTLRRSARRLAAADVITGAGVR
ncbi:hypothetical protein GCM10010988_19670 [Cnuibacter physcomitrellae]|nr:hypothetical protein GCM10010988_19670 [Cnuibacter physcomitrellae]